MLAKRIIPCLDVTGGRVVKGVNFVGLIDAGDPVEIARRYDAQGADELVFLDITASSDARATMVDVVRRTAAEVFIPLTVGGGIRTAEDIRRMLLAGADKTSVNTAAIQRPDLIREGAERFGSQCVVLAIDARRVPGENRWTVFSHGGRRPTGLDAVEWAVRGVELGAGEILLTSMDADGTCAGYGGVLLSRCSLVVLQIKSTLKMWLSGLFLYSYDGHACYHECHAGKLEVRNLFLYRSHPTVFFHQKAK